MGKGKGRGRGELEEPDREGRETWTNPIDFLLACIGFSVGLGNVWRFPYLCYKNGGGAFLVPYLICVVVGGIPLFFIEVALGQFMQEGGPMAWRICPIFQGIGYSVTVIVFFLNCYYNVILAWAFYYMLASFNSVLPWINCGNYWNTDLCRESFERVNGTNGTIEIINYVYKNGTKYFLLDPTTEFWENKVLGISNGIHEVGMIKWDLALCLVLAWAVVYFCIWKGIKSSGKVMYVTATSPYIFMLILLIRGCLLDGAKEGILYYLVPDFEKIKDPAVWVDAGTQIFFSYSISLGALTALGSYNKFHHNAYRDSILFACANSGTSIFAGFVIFSTIGYMAKQQGVPVSDVAAGGPGLAFIAYPKAVSLMPVSPLWSFLFFLMVILLGLDSQFVGVEGLVTACVDTFPSLRKGNRREVFILIMCIIMCLIGLSMVTNGGMYVFQLMDHYSGSRIILLVAFFECVAIAMVYGVNRFYDNLEMMFGFRINPYMKVSWVFTAPTFCMVVFCFNAWTYSELSYDRVNVPYDYPDWAVAIGWSMAALSSLFIPLVAFVNCVRYIRNDVPLSYLFKPEGLKAHQLRDEDFDLDELRDISKEGEEKFGYETYANLAYEPEKSEAEERL